MIRKLLFLGLLTWAAGASAVSKVGGGTLWNPEVGFSTSIAPQFNRFNISSNDNVVARGRPILDGRNNLVPQALYVFMLHNEQPFWVGKTDRAAFADYYLASGWTQIPHRQPCVEIWRKVFPESATWILSWGGGYGILVSTTRVLPNLEAAEKTVNDLLLTMDCQWK